MIIPNLCLAHSLALRCRSDKVHCSNDSSSISRSRDDDIVCRTRGRGASVKKVSHGCSILRGAGTSGQTHGYTCSLQYILVVIGNGRLIAWFHLRTNYESSGTPATSLRNRGRTPI